MKFFAATLLAIGAAAVHIKEDGTATDGSAPTYDAYGTNPSTQYYGGYGGGYGGYGGYGSYGGYGGYGGYG
jgi:hypothetical protein